MMPPPPSSSYLSSVASPTSNPTLPTSPASFIPQFEGEDEDDGTDLEDINKNIVTNDDEEDDNDDDVDWVPGDGPDLGEEVTFRQHFTFN